MSEWVWCDGALLQADDLRVSPFDRGLTVGLGLFETLLAVAGEPQRLVAHVERHAVGCRVLGWPEPDWWRMREGIQAVLEANGLHAGKARVRWFQTAGAGGLGERGLGKGARCLITASALPEWPESVSLTMSPWVRNERSPLVGLKCASYAENLLAMEEAKSRGFDEPLFLNGSGEVCEAATANVFLVRGERVWTPPLSSGCLPGVARAWVLEQGRKLGLDVRERALRHEDLREAEEMFLTSSLRGVVGVHRWENSRRELSEITQRLAEVFAQG